MEPLANLSLFFNYFFALGRTVDTEGLAMVASRSPLYPASWAFFARDALLWSLPAVVAIEPTVAQEMLAVAFTRHLMHAGDYGLYLDGGLDHYLRKTGDETLVHEPFVAHGLRHLETRLFSRPHVAGRGCSRARCRPRGRRRAGAA